jgi:hypothetical protein
MRSAGRPTMTPEEYYAIVHKLRLTRTKVQNVYIDERMETQHVTDPNELDTPDQVRRAAVRLILLRGRELSEFGLD